MNYLDGKEPSLDKLKECIRKVTINNINNNNNNNKMQQQNNTANNQQQ